MTRYDNGVGSTSLGVRETRGKPCVHCGRPGFEHEKRRVTPDDGPPGSWHYEMRCPRGGRW